MPMPIPTPRQAAEELARRSLSDFARTMIPALDLTPFHRSYYDTLDRFARGEIRRLIVSIPPQHGKSLGSSVLLPAYLLGPGSPTAGSRWLPTTCVWPHGSTGRFSGSWTHPLTGAFSPEPASNALPPRIAALCARPRSSNWSAPEAGC